MRSSVLFGVSLILLLDLWKPVVGLCSSENATNARCHDLKDIRYIDTYNLRSLKAPVKSKILTQTSLLNLNTLRYLDLSEGDLEEISPGSFLQLPKLLTLNLAENHIEHLNSSCLDGLMNLQNLSLKKNNIHHIPEALLDLGNLKVLDVSSNQLNCSCETLKLRDKLLKRGVKILKKALCSGPVGVKGLSLLKPSSKLVCIFEEQDDGMQMDQPIPEEADGFAELGSGDEETDLEDVKNTQTQVSDIAEVLVPETLAPDASKAVTHVFKTTSPNLSQSRTSVAEKPVEPTQATLKVERFITSVNPVEVSIEKSELKEDDDLSVDFRGKSTRNPSHMKREEQTSSDNLFSPIDGSGNDNLFEGSGTLVPPIDFGKLDDETVFETTDTDETGTDKESDMKTSLFENLFGTWSDKTLTATPEEKNESDIVKEEFLPVIPAKASEAEEMLPKNNSFDSSKHKSGLSVPDTIEENTKVSRNGETKQEIADASSQETKIGNGSMVVLISLLGIFVALVGLAAYKGDLCRKKRVPDDSERGTELKEMQKSLLEGGDSIQPKISNGNTENVPMINVSLYPESNKEDIRNQNGNAAVDDIPSNELDPSATEVLDPVKTPRKLIFDQEFGRATNGNSSRGPYIDPEMKFDVVTSNSPMKDTKTPPNTPMVPMDFGSPPLSPNAQRVKIILQDNPDSVPKTPILITRTKMGGNLVKTP